MMQNTVEISKDNLINELLVNIVNKYQLNVADYKNGSEFEIDKLLADLYNQNLISPELSKKLLKLLQE